MQLIAKTADSSRPAANFSSALGKSMSTLQLTLLRSQSLMQPAALLVD
jgi:hypothetical protein